MQAPVLRRRAAEPRGVGCTQKSISALTRQRANLASQRTDVCKEELQVACESISLDLQLPKQPAPRLQSAKGQRPYGRWQERIRCTGLLCSADVAARQRVLRGLLRSEEQQKRHKPRHREEDARKGVRVPSLR